jgi:hypothetical protein
MKNIKNYKDFCNEEVNWKKALIGTAIAGAVGASVYKTSQITDYAELGDTEIVDGVKFNQYEVYTNGETFDLNISEDGVISSSWSEEKGSGKDERTVTYCSITIPKDISVIWYEDKMDMENSIFVSGNKINGGTRIDLSELSIVEETETYIIYESSFFSSIDFIVVNKGHKSGEEFKVEGSIGKYICDKIGDTYLFGLKSLGGGSFGGAGTGASDW